MVERTKNNNIQNYHYYLAVKCDKSMWQGLKNDFTAFVRAAGEEGGSAIASLDKKLNDLDDKLTEVTGGNRNEDGDSDDIDYTGGDANDVLYNNEVGEFDSNISPPDLRELSDAAMSVGKTAASFLAGVGEKVGVAATSMRMHQSGRPPFVMTAVEDDDDEYVEEEEYDDDDDEGEELGWSESEEEGEDDSDGDEVDFTNKGQSRLPLESLDVVKIRESLKTAEEERNQCMQLVEDRNQEICRLKLALEQSKIHESALDPESLSLDDLRREVLWFRKLIAVTRKEEAPTELKSTLSQMKEASNQKNIAKLGTKIQSVKDNLATSYAKIDKILLAREAAKQKTLKEQMEGLGKMHYTLQNEISSIRDNITQLKLQELKLEEQHAGETDGLVRQRDSPTSSTSSGVLI